MKRPRYISTQYTPEELRAVLDLLEARGMTITAAHHLLLDLNRAGYRIVKTGKQE